MAQNREFKFRNAEDRGEEVTNEIGLAERCDVQVLLLGPTGTGKSTLAYAIHQKSSRKHGPFVTVNLASLHEETLESELFGHERGAFTGALTSKKGKLELAQGGTVFLDEIGDLSLKLQARLLEFLQERKVTPIGSNRERHLDLRVVAATHRNLPQMIAQGLFREDLYHRLRMIEISLPSLSEGVMDFDELVHGLLEELATKHSKKILSLSARVASCLDDYRWPGNIRELKNVLELAVIAAPLGVIEYSHLPSWFRNRVAEDRNERGDASDLRPWKVAEVPYYEDFESTLARFEREFLSASLARWSGRINLTARNIGINKTTLIRRIRLHQLARKDYALCSKV
jgi:DNA-binding NtrC family response regulator